SFTTEEAGFRRRMTWRTTGASGALWPRRVCIRTDSRTAVFIYRLQNVAVVVAFPFTTTKSSPALTSDGRDTDQLAVEHAAKSHCVCRMDRQVVLVEVGEDIFAGPPADRPTGVLRDLTIHAHAESANAGFLGADARD